MDTIFNIFGSHEAVKPPTVNPHDFQRQLATKELLPGKANLTSVNSTEVKKVLSDVGNKMKSLKNKQDSEREVLKKPLLDRNIISKTSCETVKDLKSDNIQQEIPGMPKFTSQFLQIHDELDEWAEAETQGPLFWNDDEFESMWPNRPTVEDYYNAVNVWDRKEKRPFDLSASPVSVDMNDDLEFCLDLPKSSPAFLFEEAEVPYPWEL